MVGQCRLPFMGGRRFSIVDRRNQRSYDPCLDGAPVLHRGAQIGTQPGFHVSSGIIGPIAWDIHDLPLKTAIAMMSTPINTITGANAIRPR